jgi:pimeloyl-ACP methyl ester carboxylesterase
MRALSDRGWRGVAVARRGRCGVGPERAEGLRIADYVEDTLRVIEALGELPVLVAHSLGGLVAQKVAEAGKCRGLVLLAPSPAAMLTAQPVALPAYLPMMPKILMGAPILPACSACERIALNCVPEAERAAIHDGFHFESGLAYREMIFGAVKVDPKRVQVPTLVLAGKEDRIVAEGLSRFTAERYGGTLKVYEGHAHWLLGEPGWERIAADAAAWLGERTV